MFFSDLETQIDLTASRTEKKIKWCIEASSKKGSEKVLQWNITDGKHYQMIITFFRVLTDVKLPTQNPQPVGLQTNLTKFTVCHTQKLKTWKLDWDLLGERVLQEEKEIQNGNMDGYC